MSFFWCQKLCIYLVLDSAYAKHHSNYFIFSPAGIEHQFGALCGCPKVAMEHSFNTYLCYCVQSTVVQNFAKHGDHMSCVGA